MKIKVYQINLDRDTECRSFRGYNGKKINSSIYDTVFDGNVNANNLEDIYTIFNIDPPLDYHGRSMSVSDIVEVDNKFFYCDNIGFANVDFDSNSAVAL